MKINEIWELKPSIKRVLIGEFELEESEEVSDFVDDMTSDVIILKFSETGVTVESVSHKQEGFPNDFYLPMDEFLKDYRKKY